VASDAPTFSDRDLKQWKLIKDFRTRLQDHFQSDLQHPSWEDPRRGFEQLDYLSLWNPIPLPDSSARGDFSFAGKGMEARE
jgi:hypothetical protein